MVVQRTCNAQAVGSNPTEGSKTEKWNNVFALHYIRVLNIYCVQVRYSRENKNTNGEVAEWTIAPVLKTGGPKGPGGSNPSLSAKLLNILNKSYCRYQIVIVTGGDSQATF